MIANLTKTAVEIASTNIHGGEFANDIGSHWTKLMRTRNGKFAVVEVTGFPHSTNLQWLESRDEAVAWIAEHAEDAITGYGYTREQAEVMVDGVDAGKGYRGQ